MTPFRQLLELLNDVAEYIEVNGLETNLYHSLQNLIDDLEYYLENNDP